VPQYLDYKTYIQIQFCSTHKCAAGFVLRSDAASIQGDDGETCCLPKHSYAERPQIAKEVIEVYAKFPVSLEECEELCDLTEDCRSFAYSAKQQSCHLKEAASTMEEKARKPQYLDYKTYVQIPLCSSHVCAEGTILRIDAESIPDQDGESCCLPRHNYTERSLVAKEGNGVQSRHHFTLAECEELCDLAGACRSFAYSAVQRACFLKDAVVTEEDAARVPQVLDYKTYIQM